MAFFKKVSSGMLYKGGVFGTGVLGVYLWRRQHLPQYMGVISMGVTSLGLCSALWDIWKGEDTNQQDSYNAECKEIVDILYRKVKAKAEEQESQQRSEDGTEEQEEEWQFVNGCEQSPVPNHSESKLPAVPNGTNIASAHGSSSRTLAANFSQNDVSKADERKVDELAAEVSEVPILEDDVDEALAREFAIKELEAKSEKTEDVSEKKEAAENGTSDKCDGQVFQATSLFKLWDSKHPDIQKELASVNWPGKGANVKKLLKGGNTKRSPAEKKGN